ncbi:MAG: glucose 1-dehydrogenase [Betaproteobacteria bacterium]|jgi:NAD(P)-dependent dehydrogenase (short-subunit alcohol dehydrogenase family)|nr:glucose 1-dehydrogenase [Betaproteobacteria bacterium]MBK7654473.1 glucose 1-dehydrogenase [Betaproteobacteria bacterium]MBP6645794.1 glucose 1-dehydrogenase [Burkholderiaceae bacterium]
MNITSDIAPEVLKGKLALVTGGGQGNGRAIARGLANAGARVIVTDINAQTAQQVADEILAQGRQAWAFRLDVTSTEACQGLASQVGKDIGPLDLLVNNAGIIIREGMDSPKVIANLERTMNVNVMGTFLPIQAWLPALRATRGCIVNVASIASSAGLAGVVGYSPSKGAVKMLTQALAAELAKDGVRVNAIAPGVIETPMTAATRDAPEKLEKFMARTPMARVGQAEELIGPVVFLASPMATYVTGVTLPVDGGFLAG